MNLHPEVSTPPSRSPSPSPPSSPPSSLSSEVYLESDAENTEEQVQNTDIAPEVEHLDAMFDLLQGHCQLKDEEEEIGAHINNVAGVLSACISPEEREAIWEGLINKISQEMGVNNEAEFRCMVTNIIGCLGNEEENDRVKLKCMSCFKSLIRFQEGGSLSSEEIAQVIPLLTTLGQRNDQLLNKATSCLSQLVLFKYHLLGDQKKLVASHILSNWGKETFEEVAQLAGTSHLQDSNFLAKMETIRTKNSLPCYISILGLFDGLQNEELMRELMKFFAKLDRSTFHKGWDIMEANWNDCHVSLLKNFLLGSLGDICSQNLSSIVIADLCFHQFPKGRWQNLKDQLLLILQRGTGEMLKGTWKTIQRIADECLRQGSLSLQGLVSVLFNVVFDTVTHITKRRNLDAIKTLETIMLCQPTSITDEKSREKIRRKLVRRLPRMEKSMKEEATRAILPRLTSSPNPRGKLPPGSSSKLK